MSIITTTERNVGTPGHDPFPKRTLAYYRSRFPNIDWSKPSPAAEFAIEPGDVRAVFAEMKTQSESGEG